jgi:hypothetical protein
MYLVTGSYLWLRTQTLPVLQEMGALMQFRKDLCLIRLAAEHLNLHCWVL